MPIPSEISPLGRLRFDAKRFRLDEPSVKSSAWFPPDLPALVEQVLLVDPSHGSRRILATEIERLGFSVITARDGEEAIDRYENNPTRWLMVDLALPPGHALRLIRNVRSINGNHRTRIVALESDTAHDVFEAIEAGANAFVPRGADKAALLAALIDRDSTAGNDSTDGEPDWAEIQRIHGACFISSAMRDLARQALALHRATETPVLICGETGTGKEVLARLVHQGLNPKPGPFVDVNCAAVSPTLFESELFGYEAGAFTGAKRDGCPGKIELANGGTLLLDELGEMPLDLQSKLLRVLEERVVRRVGGTCNRPVNIRVVGTTNCDLRKMIAEHRFRPDLYFRLNVGVLHIPPLRERGRAIGPLALHFLRRAAQRHNKVLTGIAPDILRKILDYPWPGNVRELRNVIDRAVLFETSSTLRSVEFDLGSFTNLQPLSDELATELMNAQGGGLRLPDSSLNLPELEATIIRSALLKHNDNKTRTAAYLGISRSKLLTRIKQIESS